MHNLKLKIACITLLHTFDGHSFVRRIFITVLQSCKIAPPSKFKVRVTKTVYTSQRFKSQGKKRRMKGTFIVFVVKDSAIVCF